jgi:hypothetical protein
MGKPSKSTPIYVGNNAKLKPSFPSQLSPRYISSLLYPQVKPKQSISDTVTSVIFEIRHSFGATILLQLERTADPRRLNLHMAAQALPELN